MIPTKPRHHTIRGLGRTSELYCQHLRGCTPPPKGRHHFRQGGGVFVCFSLNVVLVLRGDPLGSKRACGLAVRPFNRDYEHRLTVPIQLVGLDTFGYFHGERAAVHFELVSDNWDWGR
jgi:hypothetical protein